MSGVARVAPRARLPVRLLNAVGRRAGNFGALGRLDAEEMVRDARRSTGLSDLGPDTEEAQGVLVASLEAEARLTPLGRVVLGRMLRGFLVQRLRVVDALRRRPDLAAAPVRRPVFVAGYWRTGTTLLHNLLSQADGARPLLGYEAFDPLPPALAGGPDLRRARYDLLLRGLYYLGPELAAAHDECSDGPTECFQPLVRTFATLHLPMMADVPSYERWLWEQDTDAFTAVYELHRMQLQTLQADGRPGYWVLKSPAHLSALEALLKVYPDAVVVQTHRDLAKVLGSTASLVSLGTALLADEPHPHVVGRRVLDRTVRTLERAEHSRAVVGDDRVVDVRYADLVTDPISVVRRIHQHLDAPLSRAAEGRMRRWLADNPQGKRGTHRYSLEQFGLDRATVERAVGPYRERYGVPPED